MSEASQIELDTDVRVIDQRIAVLEARAERAEAEVARLGEAMRQSANDIQDYIDDDTGIGPLEEARDRLRAALQEKPHD